MIPLQVPGHIGPNRPKIFKIFGPGPVRGSLIPNIELMKATESKMKKVIRSDYVAERKISKQSKIESSESSQDQKENVKTENPEPVNGSEKSKKRSKWAAMAAERELWENEGFELPKPKISETKKPIFIKPDIKEMETPKSTKPISISGMYLALYRHLVVNIIKIRNHQGLDSM